MNQLSSVRYMTMYTDVSKRKRFSFCREHRVEILDRCYQPMILLIEEGDKIWFSWDKNQVTISPQIIYLLVHYNKRGNCRRG